MNPHNLLSISCFRLFTTGLAAVLTSFTLFWSGSVNAQASTSQSAPASAPLAGDEISVAVREYLKVSGAESQHQVILNFMTDAAVNATRTLLSESLRTSPIDAKNPLSAQPIVNKRLGEFAQSARKQLAAKYTWSKIIEDIYQPVFRRGFTLAELKTAIEYYKSPVGKKFVEKTPQMYADAMRSMSETYKQGITDEVQPLAVEFVQKIRTELKAI